MSTVVPVGVIGYGYWGPNLVRNFSELPNVEMVGVADRSEDQLKRVRSKYPNIEATTDYHKLIEMGVKAVAIATPPATHHAIAKDCLENGVSVMIEKPMTLNTADAEDLVRTAEEYGQVLMVGHTFEYNPAVRMIKEIVDSGELGDIYYIDMVRVNLGLFQPKANVVWDLAPHDISILLYLLGEEPEMVTVQGVDSVMDGLIDLAYMSLRFPSGIHGHIQCSWLSPRKIRSTTIVGSKKMIIYDDVEPVEKIKIFDKGVDGPPPYTETLEQFHWSYRHGDMRVPHINFSEPLRLETQEFVDAVIEKRAALTDGYNGMRVVRVLEMAQKSLDSNGASQQMPSTQETFATDNKGN